MAGVQTDNREAAWTPDEVRMRIRTGAWPHHTAGLAPEFVQANLVILPAEYAYDFLLFCTRNPKPCPILEVTDTGSPIPVRTAPDADLRTDLPRYCVYVHGHLVEQPPSIAHHWRDDFVAFLLGCSYSFEYGLVRAGIELPHWTHGTTVSMYHTSRACLSAGRFHGRMVVSMRPIPAGQVARAVEISGRYPLAHGAPVHVGDPASLGIADLARPDWGDTVAVAEASVPVFWACGVTPQAVAIESAVPLMITHAPGHMFITDIPVAQMAV
jgi:uncharacterized protein YcsI (UPF0317 family)